MRIGQFNERFGPIRNPFPNLIQSHTVCVQRVVHGRTECVKGREHSSGESPFHGLAVQGVKRRPWRGKLNRDCECDELFTISLSAGDGRRCRRNWHLRLCQNPLDLENTRSVFLRWSSMPTMHRGVHDRNEVEGEPS